MIEIDSVTRKHMDELRVAYDGKLYRLWDLPREKLQKIWEDHRKKFSSAELDFVLCSHNPLPQNDLFALTLRAVDRLLSILSIEETHRPRHFERGEWERQKNFAQ